MSDFLTRRVRQAVTLNVAIGLMQSEPELVDQLVSREGVEGKIDAEEMVTILEELKL